MITIALPTMTDQGLESIVSPYFGHALYFTLVTLNDDQTVQEVKTIEKPPYRPGQAPLLLVDHGVNLVLACSIGRPATQLLQRNSIALIPNLSGSVQAVLAQYQEGNLEPLDQFESIRNYGAGYHLGRQRNRVGNGLGNGFGYGPGNGLGNQNRNRQQRRIVNGNGFGLGNGGGFGGRFCGNRNRNGLGNGFGNGRGGRY